MAPGHGEERVYRMGERVLFCGWPSTVVHVNPPNWLFRRHEYQVCMDGDPVYCRTTDLQRTAIGVHGEDLQPLEEGSADAE